MVFFLKLIWTGLMRSSSALVNQHNTGKDKSRCQNLLPGEAVHAGGYSHYGGDERLNISVKADDSRAKHLLPYRYQEIGDEGGKENHKTKFEKVSRRHSRHIETNQLLDIERDSDDGREEEHPLHESHHAVFCDERTESSEIHSKKDAVANHIDDAHGPSLGDTATLHSYCV